MFEHAGLHLHRALEELDGALADHGCTGVIAVLFERFGVTLFDQAFGLEQVTAEVVRVPRMLESLLNVLECAIERALAAM